MPELLILGIYPHAVEMADIVARINRVEHTWDLVGFVSAYGERVGEEILGVPVFGHAEALSRYPEAFLVPEYDWPNRGEVPRERLATLIDPSTFVARTAQIGAGGVVYPNCFIGAHARVGDLFFCLSGSVVNHNDVIGDRVTLTSGVMVAGDVHVEDGCYLGQSCTIREMHRIGRGSLIGMGSVVLDDVKPNSVMIGNPARRLRAREGGFSARRVLRGVKRRAGRGARALRQQASVVVAKCGGFFRVAGS